MVLVSALLAIVVALAQHGARDDFLRCARAHVGLPAVERAAVRAGAVQVAALAGETLAACFLDRRIEPGRRHRRARFRSHLPGSDAPGKASSACPQEFSRASTGSSCCPMSGIAAIVGALALRYFHVAHEWRRNIELEARARIRALQARIQPHFLFNSMNAIAALTRTDPARAEEAIEDLSDLFRFNLADAHGQITLREELEVARVYQRIEQLRLGDRLQVSWLIERHAGARTGAEPADAAAARECDRARDRIAARRRHGDRAGAGWTARRSRSGSRTPCRRIAGLHRAATGSRSTTSARGWSSPIPAARAVTVDAVGRPLPGDVAVPPGARRRPDPGVTGQTRRRNRMTTSTPAISVPGGNEGIRANARSSGRMSIISPVSRFWK